jgi:DNA-binding response OmpR family regulator
MEAVSYLSGTERFSDRSQFPLPTLILLDIRLPQKSGLEVLEWLRSEESLRGIPVVVLTSSAEVKDVRRSYDLGAKAFIVKPLGMDPLRELVRAVDAYWNDPESGIQGCLGSFATPRPQMPAS